MTLDLDDLARDVLADPPTRIPGMDALQDRVRRRRRTRRVITGVAATPLVALAAIGAWSVLDRDDPPEQVITADIADPDIANTPDTDTSSAATEWAGPYVWPAPRRSFDNVYELVDRFVDEVLRWDPGRVRVDGADRSQRDGLGSLTLVDTTTDRELHLLAEFGQFGWGFVQIGDGGAMVIDGAAGSEGAGGKVVRFLGPNGTTTNTVVIRYSDGTTSNHSVITQDGASTSTVEVPLPAERAPQSIISVLVVHADASGATIGASGGQFGDPQATDTSPGPGSPSVSTGAVTTPDLIGTLAEDARGILESLGLESQVVETVGPDVAPGTVLTSEPGPGLTVPIGTTITLIVAAPPES